MHALQEQFDRLQEKLQELLKQQRQLKKDNERLSKELLALQSHQAGQLQQMQEMEQKLAAARLVNGNWSDTEKQQLQKKIDSYLKEIDRCLALLHA